MNWTAKIALTGIVCLALICVVVGDSQGGGSAGEKSKYMVLIVNKEVKMPTVKVIFTDKLKMIDKLYSSKITNKDYSIQRLKELKKKGNEQKSKENEQEIKEWENWRKGLGPMPIGKIMDVKWTDKAIWFVGERKSSGWGCIWIDTQIY